MLHSGRLLYKEGGVGFAYDFPVAQIAVIRSVYLADALGLYNRTLEGLGGDHGAHTDAVSLWYGHSHGL